MLRLVLPAVFLIVGSVAGVGAGLYLSGSEPAPECDPADADCAAPETASAPVPADDPEEDAPAFDYVKLNNQFVIPIVAADTVTALVVVSLTLEVSPGSNTMVFDVEPRLRDAFLQAMFDFAYLGGFDGPFTKSANLASLRRSLREIGQRIVGPEVHDVLIVDIVRQEV